MTAVHLPPDVCEHALELATREAFPEIVRILRVFQNGSGELSLTEASRLLDFARFLVHRAALHFPYWDDTREPFSSEHEEAFQQINMGIHEKLFSYIGSSFPELLE
jgi:hypothetical protein